MKTTLLLSLGFGIVTTCAAQQTLAEYDWSKLAQGGQLLGGEPLATEGRTALKVVNTNDTALQAQLVKLEDFQRRYEELEMRKMAAMDAR